MKSKQFEVPQEQIVEFCQLIEEHELENQIIGVTDDENILIEVSYEQNDRSAMMELVELIEVDDEDDD